MYISSCCRFHFFSTSHCIHLQLSREFLASCQPPHHVWKCSTSGGRRDGSASIYDVGRATTRPSTCSLHSYATTTVRPVAVGLTDDDDVNNNFSLRFCFGQQSVVVVFFSVAVCFVFSLVILLFLARWADYCFVYDLILLVDRGHETPETPVRLGHVVSLAVLLVLLIVSFRCFLTCNRVKNDCLFV